MVYQFIKTLDNEQLLKQFINILYIQLMYLSKYLHIHLTHVNKPPFKTKIRSIYMYTRKYINLRNKSKHIKNNSVSEYIENKV